MKVACMKKMTKHFFPSKVVKSEYVLNIIHSDIYDSMSVQTRNGHSYSITFINELLHKKSEALEVFKQFKLEEENATNRRIKTLHSNHGGEYKSDLLEIFYKENCIIYLISMPHTPSRYILQTLNL